MIVEVVCICLSLFLSIKRASSSERYDRRDVPKIYPGLYSQRPTHVSTAIQNRIFHSTIPHSLGNGSCKSAIVECFVGW